MDRIGWGWLCLACVVACLATAIPALAQVDVTPEATARARAHYDRGVGLFDEGQFVAALAEFEAAYELTHRPSLLFNIGQIHARLGHAVESSDSLERYLAEGREIDAERRALVEGELDTQRARIARVTVSTSVTGARVSLDDVPRGETPLAEPLRVGAGEHVLVVTAEGYETARQRFRIAGGEARDVRVELTATGAVSTRAPITAISERPFPALTVTGVVVAGAGLVTFGAGGIATLLEHASLTSDTGCSPSCTPEQTSTISATRIVADVGLGVLAVGGVLAIVGAVIELGGSNETSEARVALLPDGVEVVW